MKENHFKEMKSAGDEIQIQILAFVDVISKKNKNLH
jgi:hypothetical protein